MYNGTMDEKNLPYEICDGFTLLTPKVLGPNELDHLSGYVEELLVQKKQELVLCLVNVETVFSSHLTAFVQVYRLLKSFNLRFIIADISPAVLNVMQMTQLDSLLPLFLTIQDYKDAVALKAEDSASPALDFTYSLQSKDGAVQVECRGYMSFGENVRKLQSELLDKSNIRIDLSQVGYMDTRVLIMLADLASRSVIEVVGASNVIRELFEQHRIQNKVKFVD